MGILPLFFHNNPTIDEVESVLPQLVNAFTSAKAGQAFEITGLPVSVDGVRGAFSFSWSPNASTAPVAG
jgi:hypothetical protein